MGAEAEEDDRGWDGWMASLIQWTGAWTNSGRRWGTGKPGVLRFMRSHKVRHDWMTKLNWTEIPRTAASRLKVIPAMLKECLNLNQKTWVLVLSKPVISVIGIPHYLHLSPGFETVYWTRVASYGESRLDCLWSLRHIGMKRLFWSCEWYSCKIIYFIHRTLLSTCCMLDTVLSVRI